MNTFDEEDDEWEDYLEERNRNVRSLVNVSSDEYELKRQTWYSQGFGFIFPEPTRRVFNLRKLLELYKQDPVIQAGINKRSRDLFEAGVTVKSKSKTLEKAANKFLTSRLIKMKWNFSNAAEDAFVYGNGFLEIGFDDDDNVSSPDLPPAGNNVRVRALHRVNPETIVIVYDDIPESLEYGRVVGYISLPPIHQGFGIRAQTHLSVPLSNMNTLGRQGKFIHPSRILHFKFNTMGDSNVGISLLEPAYNTMKAKIDADEVIGTIMTRYAKPILEMIGKNAKPNTIKKLGQIAQAINSNPKTVSHFAHDDKIEFKIPSMGGKSLNPKDYYKIIFDNIATAVRIPKALLIGVEQGSISGSDLNLVAYFQNVDSEQQNVIKDLIFKLLDAWHLAEKGVELPEDVDIDFGRLYADEIAAIKSNMLGIQSLVVAFDKGLVPREGSRERACDLLNIECDDFTDEDAFNVSKGDGFPSDDNKSPFSGQPTKDKGMPAIKTPQEEGQ